MEIPGEILHEISLYMMPQELYNLYLSQYRNDIILNSMIDRYYNYLNDKSYRGYFDASLDVDILSDKIADYSTEKLLFETFIRYEGRPSLNLIIVDRNTFRTLIFNSIVLFFSKHHIIVDKLDKETQLMEIARLLLPYDLELSRTSTRYMYLDVHRDRREILDIENLINSVQANYNISYKAKDVLIYIVFYINQILGGYNKYLKSINKENIHNSIDFINYINNLKYKPKILYRSNNVVETSIGIETLNFNVDIVLADVRDIGYTIIFKDYEIEESYILSILIQLSKIFNSDTILNYSAKGETSINLYRVIEDIYQNSNKYSKFGLSIIEGSNQDYIRVSPKNKFNDIFISVFNDYEGVRGNQFFLLKYFNDWCIFTFYTDIKILESSGKDNQYYMNLINTYFNE